VFEVARMASCLLLTPSCGIYFITSITVRILRNSSLTIVLLCM
jgi:hypothetical protein